MELGETGKLQILIIDIGVTGSETLAVLDAVQMLGHYLTKVAYQVTKVGLVMSTGVILSQESKIATRHDLLWIIPYLGMSSQVTHLPL